MRNCVVILLVLLHCYQYAIAQHNVNSTPTRFYITDTARRKLTGTVVNKQGSPLSGASVVLKNENTGVATATDGTFALFVKTGDLLEVTMVGYKPLDFIIENQTAIQVSLSLPVTNLDEVILTGYKTQKVKEITGSVAVVKPKDLTDVPAGTVEQMLQGRVAGLTVITSGEPGAPANIRLHGIGNFGDVTPLYIIDGIEGDINALNPYDIESLQVLKDAGAYSIYGVRGANGVIVITTKKGKNGRTKISYDAYFGKTYPAKNKYQLLSPQEDANLLWQALRTSHEVDTNGNPSDPIYGNGPTPVLPDIIFAGPYTGLSATDPRASADLFNIDPDAGPIYEIVPFNKQGTDWYHELYKPAFSQNHAITLSGGNDKNDYLFSFGYLNQQGTFLNTYLKRYTTRVNTTYTVLRNLHIGENLQLSYSENPRSGNGSSGVIFTNPYLPLYDIKGYSSNDNNALARPTGNPVAERIASKDDKSTAGQVFGNAFAEAQLFKKLMLRSSFGGTFNYNYYYFFFYGTYAPRPAGYNSSFTEGSGYHRSYSWTNTATYTTTFHTAHHLKVLAGWETKNTNDRGVSGTRQGYFTNNPAYRSLSTGDPAGQINGSSASTSYLASFISQADYAFKETYFISGTLRRDEASIFGPEKRQGWFPAVGVAWRLTEEGFMKPLSWLTDLKVRGSWGKTGYYKNIDPANQYNLYGIGPGSSYYDINGTSNTIQQGIRQVRIGNARTGWQEDVDINLGIEATLWEGRLHITADWYNKQSNGLLFSASLPAILGDVMPPSINVGDIKNTGLDLRLGSTGKWGTHGSWDISATVTHYHNTIIRINNLPYFDDVYTNYGTLIRNEVGYPMSSYYGYKIIGFFQDTADIARSPKQEEAAPGRFKYADVNGRDENGKLTGKPDGKITDDDRVHYGNPNPKFTLGLNMYITYKNFDFTTFFYGSFGNDVLNDMRYTLDIFPVGNPAAKSKTAQYDSWTPQQPNVKAPIVESHQNFSNAATINSYRLENGSYFRNKTMILGYTLPKSLLEHLNAERLRFYVQAVNLFTITKYSGLDPELSGSTAAYGIDMGNYPNQRQFLVGVNLNF